MTSQVVKLFHDSRDVSSNGSLLYLIVSVQGGVSEGSVESSSRALHSFCGWEKDLTKRDFLSVRLDTGTQALEDFYTCR